MDSNRDVSSDDIGEIDNGRDSSDNSQVGRFVANDSFSSAKML